MTFRAVWVDEGNDADKGKLQVYGINSPYFSIRDPRVTKAYLQGVRAQGFSPGIYAAWNWYPALDGRGFAGKLSAELERIAPKSAPDFPKVCADIETHDVGYIRAFLKRWRELRLPRVTDWTLEAFQGGLFNAADVAAIAAANVRVIPQMYTGDMRPFAADRVALDLVQWGFPPKRIFGFYDAATLPLIDWQGFAFTQGRLP